MTIFGANGEWTKQAGNAGIGVYLDIIHPYALTGEDLLDKVR